MMPLKNYALAGENVDVAYANACSGRIQKKKYLENSVSVTIFLVKEKTECSVLAMEHVNAGSALAIMGGLDQNVIVV